jgi:hypothetical protein
MSSIDSLKLTAPIGGETTYISPITDLFRFNSLAYSAFYSHASLEICNLKLFFSTDPTKTYTLYKELTLNNNITSTGNELIPARYFKFEIENPDLNAMSLINILFTAHKTATSNIDVNLSADDVETSGIATETTQEDVRDVLETKGLNLNITTGTICESVNVDETIVSSPIPLGNGKDRYNSIQIIGQCEKADYSFVLEYSINGTSDWFSDGIKPSIFNGTPFQFSISRTHLSVPYVRVRHTPLSSNLVSMYYSLSRE